MSRDLLTLDQAKRELRILIGEDSSEADPEGEAFDPLIERTITAASAIVLGLYKDALDEYLDSDGNVIADSNGDPDIPGDVYSAAALMVHHLFEKPDDPGIPAGVMAIINLRRTPTLA